MGKKRKRKERKKEEKQNPFYSVYFGSLYSKSAVVINVQKLSLALQRSVMNSHKIMRGVISKGGRPLYFHDFTKEEKS